MRFVLVSRLSVSAALVAGAAHAAPDRAAFTADLKRNGEVSRHIWSPEAATLDVAGVPVSAGLAIGLRDSVRTQLGVAAAAALSMRVGERSSVSVLAGGNGSVMVVLQTRP